MPKLPKKAGMINSSLSIVTHCHFQFRSPYCKCAESFIYMESSLRKHNPLHMHPWSFAYSNNPSNTPTIFQMHSLYLHLYNHPLNQILYKYLHRFFLFTIHSTQVPSTKVSHWFGMKSSHLCCLTHPQLTEFPNMKSLSVISISFPHSQQHFQ